MNGKFATEKKPLPIKWFKRPSSKYEPLYLGPRVPEGRRVTQTELELASNSRKKKEKLYDDLHDRISKASQSTKELDQWQADGMPIRKFNPHGHQEIPGAGKFLGVDSDWRTKVGTKIQLPVQKPPKSPGGGKINEPLRNFGYYAGLEGLDGDHVTELQVGGIDDLKNLWPLERKENQDSGYLLHDAVYTLASGVTVSMEELKVRARTGANPPQVWIKIASTK
jgi:hypothetical protein